ncbi:unnamed protein product [Rotaria sp. Silwood2]|nr:unnamed protein product [Rotaria sp. Silwood2]
MTSFTFTLNTTIERCNKQHDLDSIVGEQDFRRWEKGKTSSMDNFRINYPLASDLNGRNYRVANAFVATVFKAYCDHYPLELSVDDFWVTIIQGIGLHLNQNAEKYRSLMVSHEEKKELTVSADDLRISDAERSKHGTKSIPGVDSEAVVGRIAELIRKDMKTDLASLITKPFSTTKPVEQAVFNCALMDAAKAYYSCGATLLCGIPEVTLRGSPDDFQQIIDSVNQLKLIFTDFHWWFDALLPHIKKLKNTAAGKPDFDWWSRICHRRTGSGVDELMGWLADFFP